MAVRMATALRAAKSANRSAQAQVDAAEKAVQRWDAETASRTLSEFQHWVRRLQGGPTDNRLTLREEHFASCRGVSLFAKHILHRCADSPPRGSVLCLVGLLGDHCNSPAHSRKMLLLARMGFDVHSFDYENLGRSEGDTRGFMPRFDDLVDDALSFVTSRVAALTPSGTRHQLFVFGEALGGSVALRLAQRLPISGAILVAPWSRPPPEMAFGSILTCLFLALALFVPTWALPGIEKSRVPPMAKRLAKVARALRRARSIDSANGSSTKRRNAKKGPNHLGDTGGEAGRLLQDISTWELNELDVTIYQGAVHLGTWVSIRSAANCADRAIESVCCPLLLLGGADDQAKSRNALEELHQRAHHSTDKTIGHFPAGKGLFFAEPGGTEWQQAEHVVRDWLVARTTGSSADVADTVVNAWRTTAPPQPPRTQNVQRWVVGCCLAMATPILAWCASPVIQ